MSNFRIKKSLSFDSPYPLYIRKCSMASSTASSSSSSSSSLESTPTMSGDESSSSSSKDHGEPKTMATPTSTTTTTTTRTNTTTTTNAPTRTSCRGPGHGRSSHGSQLLSRPVRPRSHGNDGQDSSAGSSRRGRIPTISRTDGRAAESDMDRSNASSVRGDDDSSASSIDGDDSSATSVDPTGAGPHMSREVLLLSPSRPQNWRHRAPRLKPEAVQAAITTAPPPSKPHSSTAAQAATRWGEMNRQSLHLGAPITFTNVMWFARFVVTATFLAAGGGGDVAGAMLALTLANVCGWSILFGLAAGLEAVCTRIHGAAQAAAHQAAHRRHLDLTLRRGISLLLLASLPIAASWTQAEHLLRRHLDGSAAQTARAAQRYLLLLTPDLVATSFLAPFRGFLRSQSLNKPLACASAAAIAAHVALNYIFVVRLQMGASGTAAAISVTDFLHAFMLFLYIRRHQRAAMAMAKAPLLLAAGGGAAIATEAPSMASSWPQILRVAAPCCLITCMDGWSYQIIVFLAGLLPDNNSNQQQQQHQAAEVSRTMAIVLNGNTLLYALQVAMAAGACIRVGNELGANRAGQARRAAMAALWMGAFLGCGGAAYWALSYAYGWGQFFFKGEDRAMAGVAELVPLTAAMEMGNFLHIVGGGVLRGCDRQAAAAAADLVAFYGLGIPLGIYLGFERKMGLFGLWAGLAAAVTLSAVATSILVLRTDWNKQTLRVQRSLLSTRATTERNAAKTATPVPMLPFDTTHASSRIGHCYGSFD